MAIKPVIGDFECPVGSVETIQIAPCGPPTVNRIVSILYGVGADGPKSITPTAPDTFDITVIRGPNLLQVVLNSSVAATQTVVAQQPAAAGGPPDVLEDDIEIVNGLGVWSPQINGV